LERLLPLLRSGSATREAFRVAVLGRTQAWLNQYWLEQALTGGPPPPSAVRVLPIRLDGQERPPEDDEYPIRQPARGGAPD
jgi:hypothetical protein